MKTPEPMEMLRALREGPYRARGGIRALAVDLGVPMRRLQSWLSGQRRPKYDGEQAIRRLWQAHGIDQEPVYPVEALVADCLALAHKKPEAPPAE